MCARKRSKCRGQSHNRVSVPVWFGRDSLFLVTVRCVQPKPSPVGSAVTWPTNFVGGNVALKGRGLAGAAFTDNTKKGTNWHPDRLPPNRNEDIAQFYFESNDSQSILKSPLCIMMQILIRFSYNPYDENLVFNSSDCIARGHKSGSEGNIKLATIHIRRAWLIFLVKVAKYINVNLMSPCCVIYLK